MATATKTSWSKFLKEAKTDLDSNLGGVKIGAKKTPLKNFEGWIFIIEHDGKVWSRGVGNYPPGTYESGMMFDFAEFAVYFARRDKSLSMLSHRAFDNRNPVSDLQKFKPYPLMWRPIRPGLHGVALRLDRRTEASERFFNPMATAFVTMFQDLSGYPMAPAGLPNEIYGPLALIDVPPKSSERTCLDLLEMAHTLRFVHGLRFEENLRAVTAAR